MPRAGLYKKGRGFKKYLRYAPLTLTTLASLIPKKLNAKIRIIDEGVEEVDYSKLNADLVCITSITGHVNRAYKLADSFRKRGIITIIGGPHATLLPDEAKKHADSVFIGHAYKTFPKFLEDFKKNKIQDFYFDENPCLENLPIPRRDLLKKRDYITINTIQAVFGCPNRCEFCVVSSMRSKYLKRPISEVISELKQMKSKLVFFLDPSPIEDKKYIKELYRQMIPLKIKWMGLSTSRIVDDEELLDLAVRSGCSGLLLGFESVSEKSLKKMNKQFNTLEKHHLLVKKLHENNIPIMGCFVFGSDEDDKSIFKETVDFVIKTGIDLPRFTVYTPFPGTPLFNRLKKEDRILTENWNKYNAQNVVFKPKNMTKKELEEGLEYAWKESYKVKNIAKRLLKSRTRLLYMIVANIGYMNYAKDHRKHR